MTDWAAIILATIVGGLAIVGSTVLIDDYRKFDAVKEQCEKYGHIQNETTRITCAVEKS